MSERKGREREMCETQRVDPTIIHKIPGTFNFEMEAQILGGGRGSYYGHFP